MDLRDVDADARRHAAKQGRSGVCWGKRRVARKRASSGEQHTPPMWHVTGSATAAPTPLPVAHGHPHAACHRVGTSVLQHGCRG